MITGCTRPLDLATAGDWAHSLLGAVGAEYPIGSLFSAVVQTEVIMTISDYVSLAITCFIVLLIHAAVERWLTSE